MQTKAKLHILINVFKLCKPLGNKSEHFWPLAVELMAKTYFCKTPMKINKS
jgi:hypothetical protein